MHDQGFALSPYEIIISSSVPEGMHGTRGKKSIISESPSLNSLNYKLTIIVKKEKRKKTGMQLQYVVGAEFLPLLCLY